MRGEKGDALKIPALSTKNSIMYWISAIIQWLVPTPPTEFQNNLINFMRRSMVDVAEEKVRDFRCQKYGPLTKWTRGRGDNMG